MEEQFELRKIVDERTIVNPGGMVRGFMIRGERPTEILVRFTKNNVGEILQSEETKRKFEDWLAKALYHTFK